MNSPLLNPFHFCADQLQRQALPKGVDPAEVQHRIAWLRQVGTTMPVGCNDTNIALALGRAALDSEARKHMLLTLLALQSYVDASQGFMDPAQKVRGLAIELEGILK